MSHTEITPDRFNEGWNAGANEVIHTLVKQSNIFENKEKAQIVITLSVEQFREWRYGIGEYIDRETAKLIRERDARL